jgi:peptide-methionine (R)-S-oxide reductase
MATNVPQGVKLDKSTPEETWKTILSPEEYRILRLKGTEPGGSGKYNKVYDEGTYVCAGCAAPLYKSETKFNSGCGWPAFFAEIPGSVDRHVDNTMGMKRVEITCSNCGGHLGHVFEGEGFPTPTNQRHCVNSASVKLTKE